MTFVLISKMKASVYLPIKGPYLNGKYHKNYKIHRLETPIQAVKCGGSVGI